MVIMVNSQEAAGKEIFFFLVFSHFPNMSDLCAMDSVVQCALKHNAIHGARVCRDAETGDEAACDV